MSRQSIRVAMLSVHTCPLATLGGKKTGGMNVYVRELGAELARQGFQVDVFTRSQDPCVPHINDWILPDGVRVIHIPAGPESPLSSLDIYEHLPEFLENVLAFVRQEGLSYDLIHSHYWLSGWVADKLGAVWKIPVVQMFHTLGLMKNRVASDPSQLEPQVRIEIEHQIMDRVDYLVAATPAEKIQLMWLYHANMEKIRVVPPGVDLQHFKPMPKAEARRAINVPEDQKLLLYVGRIEPLKGIDTLLESIALLKDQANGNMKQVCLSIIGGEPGGGNPTDPEMARLQALREKLGLEELVAFIGAQSQETLPYYYSAAEVVVLPSHYESFGMVALEAMACGTPVVASEVGGLAYLVQDGVTGFHVPNGEPEELAGKLSLLLENSELRLEMAKMAVDRAKNYAWETITEKIISLYCDGLMTYRA